MTFTVSTTSHNTWRRVKASHIAAACGIALLVSTVIVTSRVQQELPIFTGGMAPATVLLSGQTGTQEFVYHLVGSEGEATWWRAVLSSDSHAVYDSGQPVPNFQAIVVDRPERESLLNELSRELMQAGASARFVDLRP